MFNLLQDKSPYGCWCYFGDDHGKGIGGPIDQIDAMCKKLHDGYTCAKGTFQNVLDAFGIIWVSHFLLGRNSGERSNLKCCRMHQIHSFSEIHF